MTRIKNLTLIDTVIPKIETRSLALVKDFALVLSFAIITGICAKLKIVFAASLVSWLCERGLIDKLKQQF